MKLIFAMILVLGLGFSESSFGHGSHATGRVFFVAPNDGATVSEKVKLKFGIEGMEVRSVAGGVTERPSGHYHLIVDGGPIPEGQNVPMDEKHRHLLLGQTEMEIALSPGPHKLTLEFADNQHRAYGEKMSSTINITVK